MSLFPGLIALLHNIASSKKKGFG